MRREVIIRLPTSPALTSSGATALRKAKPEQKLSPTQALELLNQTDARVHAKQAAAEKRAEARAKGYEGEACGECGNFTLVRNGACMKCDTCGLNDGVFVMKRTKRNGGTASSLRNKRRPTWLIRMKTSKGSPKLFEAT